MIRGRVRDGAGACFALRREADAGAVAATLFVTDWTPEGSRAAAFNLDDVTVELVRARAAVVAACCAVLTDGVATL